MNFGFLTDISGNKSSKRLYGSILILMGIFLAIFLFFYSLFRNVTDTNTALDIIRMLLIAGGGLLGIGVFEGIKKRS